MNAENEQPHAGHHLVPPCSTPPPGVTWIRRLRPIVAPRRTGAGLHEVRGGVRGWQVWWCRNVVGVVRQSSQLVTVLDYSFATPRLGVGVSGTDSRRSGG
jgi:hypothetical protein